MRKYLYWFLMAILALSSLHSGCGGSSGSSDSSYNPDNTTTIYDFSVMEGSWTVSDGTGTAEGSGGTFDLTLNAERTNELGGVTFSNLQVSSNSATGNLHVSIWWSVSQNSRYVRDQLIDFSIAAGEMQRVSGNTWHTLPEAMFTVTITSPTTANMVERASVEVDGNTYNYEVSYKLIKKSNSETPNNNPNTPVTPENPTSSDNPATPDTPSTVYDFSILTGTWIASNGTGTVTGGGVNTTLSLSAGHSNTITFKNVIASNPATLEATLDIYMDAAGYSEQWEDDFGGAKPQDTGVLEFRNISGNTWRMDRTRHNGKPTYTIITLTSSTTAQVERYDEYDYQIHASYTLTKQS
ncbi:MAG: hypothetical protein IJJ91_11310 [Synergistaceae bacterium]|nr:hypothetical protein [Synergistaceae bacterium]